MSDKNLVYAGLICINENKCTITSAIKCIRVYIWFSNKWFIFIVNTLIHNVVMSVLRYNTLYIIITVLERLIKFQNSIFLRISQKICWYIMWSRKCHRNVKTNWKLCTILFITNRQKIWILYIFFTIFLYSITSMITINVSYVYIFL